MTAPVYMDRPPPKYVIGVDESGTGAWAGPFTVCAFLSLATDADWIWKSGAADSKSLTAQKRRKLCDELAACALIAQVEVVPPTYSDQRKVWREAIARAVRRCFLSIDFDTVNTLVTIDGATDQILAGYFERNLDFKPEFVVRGDEDVPQIAAASIFAKTVRSEHMVRHAVEFPMYGWIKNDGYGTAEHIAAIEKYGVTRLHRHVRPLLPYFEKANVHDQAVSRPVQVGGGPLRPAG